MLAIFNHHLAQYAPWLESIVIKSAILLLASLIAGQLLRRASAALRHFVYATSVVAVLMLPLAAALLPSLRLAVLPSSASHASSIATAPAISLTAVKAIAASNFSAENLSRHSANGSSIASPVKTNANAGIIPIVDWSSSASAAASLPVRKAFSWSGLLLLVWIGGCGLCLLRVAITRLRLRTLVRESAPVESITLASRLRWLCRDLGIHEEVMLLASPQLDVPIAVGSLSPKIVLSPNAGEWTETRRNAVLCHELAHIKRRDALTQLLASIAAALYWFNPLIWLVARAMRAERERACDDYVLAYGTAASDYAHELLEIVSSLVRPQPAAALAMARRSQLEGRVLALLNPRVPHAVLTRKTCTLLVVTIFAAAFPLAAAQLQERPALPQTANFTRLTESASRQQTLRSTSTSETTAKKTESSFANAEDRKTSGIGIPIYPNAVEGEHSDGRGTVSLIDGAHVHRLTASSYFSPDDPRAVLAFYRERLKNYGEVVQCVGGTNSKVDVQLDASALANPSACRSSDFAHNGTELKVNNSGDERVVVVVPHGAGSEIALVRYPSGFEDVDDSRNDESKNDESSPSFDCFRGKHTSETINSHTDDNGQHTWTAVWSGGSCSIDAHSLGTVRFNPEATAIESISPGGYLEINERVDGTLRHLRAEPGSNGQLTFTYKVNGSEQPFDAAAHAWLSSFLLQLERATGFSASTRVPALLKKGGPQAVLDEISQLSSDYVRHVYFVSLFENATLPSPMMVKALDQARNEISTDYDLAQVLLTIAQHYELKEESQRVAFLNAADKLGTDYEHARVLIELLKRPGISPQIVRGTLDSAQHIGTDYEKSRILTTLAGLSTFDESEISSYLNLAGSIGTDYERSRSLMALMEHQKLSSQAVSAVLKSATSIGTDNEKSRILIALSQSHTFDERQIDAYLTLVDSVGTDYERSRDLISLMDGHKLASDSVRRIIQESQKIGTDYEKARVLTDVAQRYEMDGALRDAYLKAANTIGTEYERNRTVAALPKRDAI